MAAPTLTSVSKDVKALHTKLDNLFSGAETQVAELTAWPWWKSHLGWAVACAACFVLGWLVHGVL